MEIQETDTVTLPNETTEHEVKIVDYGHGKNELLVAIAGEKPEHRFTITNHKLNECQWRDDEEVPTEALQVVEYYGYHVTDVTKRPTHGLYKNVQYLRDSVANIDENLHEKNIIGRSGVKWADESLNALSNLELLKSHLTRTQYQIVLFKAQETSTKYSDGNLEIPTTNGVESASLKMLVTVMLAYAQHDGYLEQTLLDPDTVEKLVQEPTNA